MPDRGDREDEYDDDCVCGEDMCFVCGTEWDDDAPCPTCNGDGESDESPLLPCSTCLGAGNGEAPDA